MPRAESLHWLNIVLHVVGGSLALLLGLVALVSAKGGVRHRRAGRRFVRCMGVVLATAILGVSVFSFRAFFAVITLVSLYELFGGLRALKLRGSRPRAVDVAASVAGLGAGTAFLIFIGRTHLPWSPAVIYSTLGFLAALCLYDLGRVVMPADWLRRTWRQEHLVKMIAAYSAIASAFAGTVLERWQPWSQLVPSGLGTLLMIGFIVAGPPAAEVRTVDRARL